MVTGHRFDYRVTVRDARWLTGLDGYASWGSGGLPPLPPLTEHASPLTPADLGIDLDEDDLDEDDDLVDEDDDLDDRGA